MADNGVWNAWRVASENPVSTAEQIKQVFLAHGQHLSVNVVQRHRLADSPRFFLHTHNEHDETVVVLGTGDEAETEFNVGGQIHRVRSGSVLFVPAGVIHGPGLHSSGTSASVSIYGPRFDPTNPDRQVVPSGNHSPQR